MKPTVNAAVKKTHYLFHLLSWNFWQAPQEMKMPPQYPEEEQNVYLTADLHIDQ